MHSTIKHNNAETQRSKKHDFLSLPLKPNESNEHESNSVKTPADATNIDLKFK